MSWNTLRPLHQRRAWSFGDVSNPSINRGIHSLVACRIHPCRTPWISTLTRQRVALRRFVLIPVCLLWVFKQRISFDFIILYDLIDVFLILRASVQRLHALLASLSLWIRLRLLIPRCSHDQSLIMLDDRIPLLSNCILHISLSLAPRPHVLQGCFRPKVGCDRSKSLIGLLVIMVVLTLALLVVVFIFIVTLRMQEVLPLSALSHLMIKNGV